MTWIKGTADQTIETKVSVEDALSYFTNPERFKEAYTDLESLEQVDENILEWVLTPKTEMGVTVSPNYRVRYSVSGTGMSWESAGGNPKASGELRVYEEAGVTKVHYKETYEFDVPVPKLLSKALRPIIQREVESNVAEFLELSQKSIQA